MPSGFGLPGIVLGEPLFSFVIPGRPVPWARAADGADGKKHTTARHRQFKKTVGQYCSVAMMQARLRNPCPRPFAVAMGCRVYLDVPKSWETHKDQAKRTEWRLAQARSWCIEKPDLDNWVKLPMDAMSGLAYVDDDQVVAFPHSGKWYDPTNPRLEIDIWRLER